MLYAVKDWVMRAELTPGDRIVADIVVSDAGL
jgi:hypothetical protein